MTTSRTGREQAERKARSSRHRRYAIRSLTVTVMSAAAVVLTGPAAGAGAATTDRPMTIPVTMTLSDGFTLPDTIGAGWVTLEVSTPDVADNFLHYLQGFRPHHGVSADQVVADLRKALSPTPATAAEGIVETGRDAELVGGAAVDASTTVSVTLPLTAGTYYFLDLNDLFVPGQEVALHRLRVSGNFTGQAPPADATITMRMTGGGPRFVAPSRLPVSGTFRIANRSNEIHEMAIQKVTPGTTDADVQRFFDSGGTSPFAEPSLRGLGAISPGRVAFLHIDRLPAGPYTLLCFVPDDEGGIPHALDGMHKVVSFHG